MWYSVVPHCPPAQFVLWFDLQPALQINDAGCHAALQPTNAAGLSEHLPCENMQRQDFGGSFKLQIFIFTSLGHFCNIRTFLCVFPGFSVFIVVTRKLNIVSLKDQDLKEPK